MNTTLPPTLQRVLSLIILTAAFIIVITYLCSMGLGLLVFFSTPEGLEFSHDSIVLHPLLIFDVDMTVNVGLYFLFLWWVFALCFVAAWKYREDFPSKVKGLISSATNLSPFSNNLLAMPLIASMLLVATIALHFIQSQGGIPTGEPSLTNPFLDFLQFSRAPLVEELIFRVIPMGTFLVTYVYVVGKRTRPDFTWIQRMKNCISSLLQPEKAKENVGLETIGGSGIFGGGMSWAEWTMVVFTSLIFGVAHYFGGWGAGKISQASMSGAVFALAYLYYGIQAPFLLHWYFNFYFSAFSLASSYYSAQIEEIYFIAVATNLFLGILLWASVVIFGVFAILRLVNRKPKAIPVPEPPF